MPGNRIKHNDLLPWFIQDHGTLPKAYLESCQEFFDEIQASSHKQQATSLPQSGDIVSSISPWPRSAIQNFNGAKQKGRK